MPLPLGSVPHAVRGLTQQSLQGLLNRLDADSDSAVREYETLRRKLTLFFELRASGDPGSLADETIDRVARKLDEGVPVVSLRGYSFGVAKRVLLEWESRTARERLSLEAMRELSKPDVHAEEWQHRIECLKRCLLGLPDDGRELILAYYEAGGPTSLERRQSLAQRLGLTYTNLKVRAHRIRGKLEACMRGHLEGIQASGRR